MSPPANSSDTLYNDHFGEMEDYELALFESDAIAMGRSLATTDPAEGGQSLSGIWCLFGIEICLSAAGLPSQSENCRMLRSWGEKNSHPLDPALAEDFKNRIREIARLRIIDDCDPDEIDAAANAMMERIDQAAGINIHQTADSHPAKDPALLNPVSTTNDTEIRAPSALSTHEPARSIPPWWPELLHRARDVVEESMDFDILQRRLKGRVDTDWITRYCGSSDSFYWNNSPFYPVLDRSLVAWLIETGEQSKGIYPSLLECAADPTLLDPHPHPEVRVSDHLYPENFACEARRVLYAAVHSIPPSGLRDLLPRNGQVGCGVFEEGYFHCKAGHHGKDLITFLLSGWAGVDEPRYVFDSLAEKTPCPALLWEEIEDLGLLEDIESHIGTHNNRLIHITHAWCAWCAGEWNNDTKSRLFPEKVASEYSRGPLEETDFHCKDSRFREFVAAFNQHVADHILRLTKKGSLDTLRTGFRFHRGEITLEMMIRIAEHFSADENARDLRNLLHVNTLPQGAELHSFIQRLNAIPQPVLRQIAPHTGFALPLILDAIDDSRFVHLMKAIAGAFAEPLVSDPADPSGHSAPEASLYYPGRSASGVTNLNPLYEAFLDSPVELVEGIIDIAGESRLVEGGKTRLQLMAGIPPEKESYPQFGDNPEIVRLTHRIPEDPGAWKTELQERIDGLAEVLMAGDRPERYVIHRWGLTNVRIAAKFHAEALGMGSWQDAAYNIASVLRRNHPFENGDYRIEQAPLEPGGQLIFKGKRRIKKIPADCSTLAAIAFRNHANLLNLLHLMLRQDALEHFIETGDGPAVERSQRHETIFGLDLKSWLEEWNSSHVSESLVAALVKSLEFHVEKEKSEPANRSSARRIEPPLPNTLPVNLNQLQELGWPTDYNPRMQTYESERSFPQYRLSLILRPHTSIRAKAGGLPIEHVGLGFVSITLWKDTVLEPGDPRIERIARCIAQEIAFTEDKLFKI